MTIYFYTRTRQKQAIVPLYLRCNSGANHLILKTNIMVNASFWSNKTKSFKKYSAFDHELQIKLAQMKHKIMNQYNKDGYFDRVQIAAILKGTQNGQPLRHKVLLVGFIKSHFLEPEGVSKRTIQRYHTVCTILGDFEKHIKRQLDFDSFDAKMYSLFLKYLREERKLHNNTMGGYIGVLKLWLRKIELEGVHAVNPVYKQFKKPSAEVLDTFLNEDEIQKIKSFVFDSVRLQNAQKWFVLGLRTGLRVSDLLLLKREDFDERMLRVTMQKTRRTVVIPIHEDVRCILKSEFPRKVSTQKFNLAIKEICKEVGIVNVIKGSKKDALTKRLVVGYFPKYQLISSHTCRRSFATNLYGKLPNKVIMAVTGHKTEQVFEKYIKTTNTSFAKQMEEYWGN